MSIQKGAVTIGAIAAIAVGVSGLAFAQQPEGPFYGRHMWDGPWHSWYLGPLFMFAFLLLAALLVALLVRWIGGGIGRGAHSTHHKTPVDILKERFARGEIDKEEFEERRRVLED